MRQPTSISQYRYCSSLGDQVVKIMQYQQNPKMEYFTEQFVKEISQHSQSGLLFSLSEDVKYRMFICPRSVILNFSPNWKLFQFSVNCKRPLENTSEGAKSWICLMSPVMLVLITGLQHPLSGSVYLFSACFRVFAREKNRK